MQRTGTRPRKMQPHARRDRHVARQLVVRYLRLLGCGTELHEPEEQLVDAISAELARARNPRLWSLRNRALVARADAQPEAGTRASARRVIASRQSKSSRRPSAST